MTRDSAQLQDGRTPNHSNPQPATTPAEQAVSLSVIAALLMTYPDRILDVLQGLGAALKEVCAITTAPHLHSPLVGGGVDSLIRESVRVARGALSGEYAESLPQVQAAAWHGANQLHCKAYQLRAGAWLTEAASLYQGGLVDVCRVRLIEVAGALLSACQRSDNPPLVEQRAMIVFQRAWHAPDPHEDTDPGWRGPGGGALELAEDEEDDRVPAAAGGAQHIPAPQPVPLSVRGVA